MLDKWGENARASGNHITQGTVARTRFALPQVQAEPLVLGIKVQIRSLFDNYELYNQWKYGEQCNGEYGKTVEGMPKSDPLLNVPVLGYLLAHDVGNYWVRKPGWWSALRR